MNTENNQGHECSIGACGSCGCGHHHMHMMKWLIKIVVLVLVFCFAFKMGELKGMLEHSGYYGGYHHGGMMLNGNDAGFDTGIIQNDAGAQTAPATPKK